MADILPDYSDFPELEDLQGKEQISLDRTIIFMARVVATRRRISASDYLSNKLRDVILREYCHAVGKEYPGEGTPCDTSR